MTTLNAQRTVRQTRMRLHRLELDVRAKFVLRIPGPRPQLHHQSPSGRLSRIGRSPRVQLDHRCRLVQEHRNVCSRSTSRLHLHERWSRLFRSSRSSGKCTKTPFSAIRTTSLLDHASMPAAFFSSSQAHCHTYGRSSTGIKHRQTHPLNRANLSGAFIGSLGHLRPRCSRPERGDGRKISSKSSAPDDVAHGYSPRLRGSHSPTTMASRYPNTRQRPW